MFMIAMNQTRIYEVYYRVVRHGYGMFAHIPNYGRVLTVYVCRLILQVMLIALAALVTSANFGLMIKRHFNDQSRETRIGSIDLELVQKSDVAPKKIANESEWLVAPDGVEYAHASTPLKKFGDTR